MMTTDTATRLRLAADCLACAALVPSEADYAAELLDHPDVAPRVADLGPSPDWRTLDALAAELEPKPRKPRKPRLDAVLKRAGKSGRRVSSLSTPDGYTLHFDEPPANGGSDEVEDWLRKQKNAH